MCQPGCARQKQDTCGWLRGSVRRRLSGNLISNDMLMPIQHARLCRRDSTFWEYPCRSNVSSTNVSDRIWGKCTRPSLYRCRVYRRNQSCRLRMNAGDFSRCRLVCLQTYLQFHPFRETHHVF